MHAEGHQIASHTWSHQNASQLTTTQFTNQMIWNEIALNSILGFFPTYMRPPYSICEKNCQDILSTLGYHVVYFDLDTEGYLHDDATEIQTSKDIWDDAIDGSDPSSDNFLQIEHDIHYQTVYNLTDYILTSLFANGYRAVTVGKCLGDPVENWYRQGPNGSITVPTTSVAPPESTSTMPTDPTRTTISVAPTHSGPSIDGTCGNGVTCAGTEFGSCCSVFGWCGDSYDHCSSEKGCQPEWGSCDGTPSTTTIPSSQTTFSTKTKTSSTKTGDPSTSSAEPTQTGLPVSTDGRCGPEVKQTCTGSEFGQCCSLSSKCTDNALSCIPLLGCQEDYGTCSSTLHDRV
ncbi:carbohydrate esterase family 4 protein [Thermothelomyces thermophilus ATCC 42464]|uniref:Carbohydrate esterase family 4 protein n=1 Tax=Thermothelomyces thermophilus (strain ATCC 42464 / BCRC 31852 / DSM 1799) TaxID=573729 RepID=G2QED3_THET4|nr:carbohydrate esterase family 4 protein [Thermothelomyces thermophilus ATCC 42464]AEO57716.1 carbohydrate esterase family 4 protein [Thermothelomyces thermophilus ATCC 42464]